MGLRIRPTVVALLALVVAAIGGACSGPPPAEAAGTPFERLALDSAAGDSAAFATLPPALASWLDVRPLLDPVTQRQLAVVECRDLESPDPSLKRRRLRMRVDDSEAIVLYAVADADTGSLQQVDLLRRKVNAGQRGISWERERDRTISTWWKETAWGLSRRMERGEIPRGGPVPRAMRALGRQLLTMPCGGSPTPDARALPTP